MLRLVIDLLTSFFENLFRRFSHFLVSTQCFELGATGKNSRIFAFFRCSTPNFVLGPQVWVMSFECVVWNHLRRELREESQTTPSGAALNLVWNTVKTWILTNVCLRTYISTSVLKPRNASITETEFFSEICVINCKILKNPGISGVGQFRPLPIPLFIWLQCSWELGCNRQRNCFEHIARRPCKSCQLHGEGNRFSELQKNLAAQLVGGYGMATPGTGLWLFDIRRSSRCQVDFVFLLYLHSAMKSDVHTT